MISKKYLFEKSKVKKEPPPVIVKTLLVGQIALPFLISFGAFGLFRTAIETL